MNIEEIERLAEVTRRCELDEIEVEYEGVKIRIRRRGEVQVVHAPTAISPSLHPELPQPQKIIAHDPVHEKAQLLGSVILSPMVGTFYRSPAPEKPAFVEVGTTVTVTSTVCVIEAMKVMNEIPAEIAGSIVEVLVKDGQPVEFGQPLFRIQPS